MRSARFGAREVLWLVLAGGWATVLYWNLPGHLSTDSVLALHEGRFGVRETWNPALFGWLLGAFDRLSRGAGLYMAAMALLLFGAWAAMALLRPRVSWAAAPAAAAVVSLPQVLIYQGIVWKDVAFANCAVAGFVALAMGLRARRAWPWLAAAALLMAAAGLFRQNGLLIVAPAALALAWAASGRRLAGRAALGLGFAAAVAALTFGLSILAQPQGVGRPDDAGGTGVRILQTYDLVAAIARDPARELPHVERFDADADVLLREGAPRAYSPERVDTLNADPALRRQLTPLPATVIAAEWRDLVLEDPVVYLRARLAAFRWVVATPVIDRCLPVHLGVTGPPQALEALRLEPRQDRRDQRLWNYGTWFLDTPAMSHLAYGAVAAVLALVLLVRREGADLPMLGMLAAALLFAASFFAISIACDYRYLYFLDLAAITGLIYFALDPRLRRRQSSESAASRRAEA
jgi:hypothetical protein